MANQIFMRVNEVAEELGVSELSSSLLEEILLNKFA
mgnify:CR=1 FL=1